MPELDDLQQARVLVLNISNEYAGDVESLFNLALMLERYIVTGEIPGFEGDDGGGEEKEEDKDDNVIPIVSRGTRH